MSKKTTRIAVKQKTTTKKPVAPAAAPSVETKTSKKKDEKITEVVPVEIKNDTNIQSLFEQAKGGKFDLDANRQVDLLTLTDKVFGKPDAESKYGKEVVESMNEVLAAGVAAVWAEQAVLSTTPFANCIKTAYLPQIKQVAERMGITFLEKALPAPDKDGNVTITKEAIKVSKETKEEIKKEAKATESIPELDPKKITSEEDLKKALRYIMITDPKKGKIHQMLTHTVDFIRAYRMEEAHKAENTVEAMENLDNRTTGEWLHDAFSLVTPTLLMRGIGGGMANTVGLSKSPIVAFFILRRYFDLEDTNTWNDQDVASAVKEIVRLVTTSRIEENRKDLALAKGEKKDDNVIKKYEETIAHHEEILKNIVSPDKSIVENLLVNKENGDTEANRIYRKIREYYFPKATGTLYKNLDYNIVQYAGIITNLFRDSMDKIEGYELSNILELTPMSKEEIEALQKAEKETKEKKD